VRVNCINPGVVETPIFASMMPAHLVKSAMDNFNQQTPLGRVGQPADIAEAALYLCSPKAAWITGALLTVDGGISLT
jgi:NAD(P)-dependent dehydrogenase (short-subunit alcohol dehydrogenase family)